MYSISRPAPCSSIACRLVSSGVREQPLQPGVELVAGYAEADA
jgi:hypothetical protein